MVKKGIDQNSGKPIYRKKLKANTISCCGEHYTKYAQR